MIFRSISIFCLACFNLWSQPYDPTILAGEVYCEESEDRLLIHASDGAVILWKEFSIGPDENIEFIQPSSQARVENRVEANPSRIAGKLTAEGRFALINSNGIVTGPDAVVQAGGFDASAPTGLMVNRGTIQCEEIRLSGYEVQNRGDLNGWEIGLIGLPDRKGPLNRFDGLKALDMPGSTVIHLGTLNGENICITAEYIDLRKKSKIYGKNIFIGKEMARIVKINGQIEGETIQILSNGALKGSGQVKGILEAYAPFLMDFQP